MSAVSDFKHHEWNKSTLPLLLPYLFLFSNQVSMVADMKSIASRISVIVLLVATVACKPESNTPETALVRLQGATVDSPFVNSLGLEFVPIPGEANVWMCRTETRVQDFRKYIEATDYVQTGGAYVLNINETSDGGYTTAWELDEDASWKNPGFKQKGNHPVVCVNWEEARAFCEWLTREEPGFRYRLPRDVEWSAAVGDGQYPWGNEWPPPKGAGNYLGREGVKDRPKVGWPMVYEYDDGSEKTARVSKFDETHMGFFDLGGNVAEWCEDSYMASMNEADVLESMPVLRSEKHGDGTSFRVVRGGSWSISSEVYVRASCRYREHPSFRLVNTGFRLVVEVAVGE